MLRIVIDTNIVLKWIPAKNEKNVSEAREIYRMMMDGELEIFAPTFLLLEVLNILANKRRTDPNVITEIIKDLAHGKINFVELEIEKISKIEKLVGKYKLTSYDALYLFLSQERNCKLLTFDNQLLKLRDLTIDINRLLKLMKSN